MTINDVITERGALNNLQKVNGIRTSTSQVEGMSLEIPDENINEEKAMLFITNLKLKILICNVQADRPVSIY